MKWTVEYYKDEAGRCHVLEFLRDIKDIKLQAKILSDIDKLEAKGTELKEPYVKHIGGGIWELRTKQSSNIARVLTLPLRAVSLYCFTALLKRP